MTLLDYSIGPELLVPSRIIDYKNEDVIFPNRPEEADKLRFNRIAAISSYLKEEGFLDHLPNEVIEAP